jgi:hypothetical protein
MKTIGDPVPCSRYSIDPAGVSAIRRGPSAALTDIAARLPSRRRQRPSF